MARNGHSEPHAPYEDGIDEDLWRSPSKKDNNPKTTKDEQTESRAGGPHAHIGKSKHGDAESKETALRNELESIRKVNKAIEGVLESLDKAKSSMGVSLPVRPVDAS